MKEKLTEFLGWYGVIAVIIAYFLLSFNFLTSSSLLFQILNFTGAIGIMVDAYQDKNY